MAEAPAPAVAGFLAARGLAGATVTPVAADWSVRRFYRVETADGGAILMHWPGGAIDRLAATTALFDAHGVPVPTLLHADPAVGLVLVEDFGMQTVAQSIDAGAEPAPMLAAAVDLLVHLHKAFPATMPGDLPAFDADTAAERAARLCDFYLPAFGAGCDAAGRARFVALWRATWPAANAVPITLAHYDFHPGNMFWRPAAPAGARIALIDHQDAVLAPVAFDLACLIQDIRRTYDPGLLADLRARYLAAFPRLDPARLDQALAVIGAQRASQILGGLGRARVEGRITDRQRADVGRTLAWLAADLAHPANAALRPWYEEHGLLGNRA
ncbi:MAG: phosphotransferase [Alphaproteobacteria bacterium]